jgi:hypothetical protein
MDCVSMRAQFDAIPSLKKINRYPYIYNIQYCMGRTSVSWKEDAPPFPFLFKPESVFDTSFTGIGTNSLHVAKKYTLGACAATFWNEAIKHKFADRNMISNVSKCAKCLVLARGTEPNTVPVVMTAEFFNVIMVVLDLACFTVKTRPPACVTGPQFLVLISLLNTCLHNLKTVPKSFTAWSERIQKWALQELALYYGLYMFYEQKIPFTEKKIETDTCSNTASHLRECQTCFKMAGQKAITYYDIIARKLKSGYETEPTRSPPSIFQSIGSSSQLIHTSAYSSFIQQAKIESATPEQIFPDLNLNIFNTTPTLPTVTGT